MIKINKIFDDYIHKIITYFLLLQPILDIITSIQTKYFEISFSFGMITRFMFLLFMLYYVAFISKSKYKKYSLYYFLCISLYMLNFVMLSYFLKGFDSLFIEISWTIKNFYFPTLLIGFINIFDEKKYVMDNEIFIEIIFTYVLTIILCQILGVQSEAYSQGKTGYIGIFYSANEVSGIFSLLLPFLIFLRKDFKKILILILTLYCTLIIGSKAAFLSLIIYLMVFLLNYLIKFFRTNRYISIKSVFITISIIAIIITLFPITPFYKNIELHMNYLEINQFSRIFESDNFNRLILSDRLTFLQNTSKIYNNAPLVQKMMGIGYYSTNGEKLIEIDYFDIFYRYGILGFITYFIPLATIIIKMLKQRLKNKIEFILSVVMSILLALFAGHIFTAPSVSIYISLIAAYIFSTKVYKQSIIRKDVGE